MSDGRRGGISENWSTPPPDSDILVLSGVSRARAWTITVVAMLSLAVTLVHRQVLAAIASTVTDALQISDVNYGWLSSGFAAAYLFGSIPAARLLVRTGPRIGLALTLALSSVVIGLHAMTTGFFSLMSLRIALGLAVAPSFACATQAVYRVLPFKDRARGVGMLYMGNSLGSAVCPPVAVAFATVLGWRDAFFWVAVMGTALIPIWILVAFSGRARKTLDPLSFPPPALSPLTTEARPRLQSLDAIKLVKKPGILRGNLIVAAAAPVTTVMLIWASKYLVRDHGLGQHEVGRYLWLPALFFGAGSIVFGELRARSTRTRALARPPRKLVALAALLSSLLAAVPLAHGPGACVLIASFAMAGSGGLYTLATSDMLAQAARGAVPTTTSFTTVTQSLVYIVISPIIGKAVQHFGNYSWVMIAAGLWVLPGCTFWLIDASLSPAGRAPHAR